VPRLTPLPFCLGAIFAIATFRSLGCAAFDESMRQTEVASTEGGAATNDAARDVRTAPDDAKDIPPGDARPAPDQCTLSAGGGQGMSDCGGKAGGTFDGDFEREPNDTNPDRSLDQAHLSCGSVEGDDVDELDFEATGCAELIVEGTASVRVEGGGVDKTIDAPELVNGELSPTTTSVRFGSSATGTVLVTVTSPNRSLRRYRLLVR
jgi:hypothetical protein